MIDKLKLSREQFVRLLKWSTSPWALAVTFVIVILCLLFPWKEANPKVFTGFDSKLIYVDLKGPGNTNGNIDLNGERINLVAYPDSQPTVHLITSDSSFTTEFDVTIMESSSSPNSETYPFLIKLWRPGQADEVELWFESGPVRQVKAGLMRGIQEKESLILSSFDIGSVYHVRAAWEKNQSFTVSIKDATGSLGSYTLDEQSDSYLINENVITLSAGASSPLNGEYSFSTMKNFQLIIPPKTRLATYVSDWRLVALALLIVIWFVLYIFGKYMNAKLFHTIRDAFLNVMKLHRKEVIVVAITFAVVFTGYLLIGTSSGHPFDRLSFENWSYIGSKYGLDAVYNRSNTAPSAAAFAGVPGDVPGYAYPPLLSYHFYLLGKIYSIFSPDFNIMESNSLMVLIKSSFGFYLLLGGLVVYIIARKLTAKPNVAYGLMLLYILNPAVVFDTMVWGQADSILIFFLLLSAAGIAFGKSRLMWLCLAVALLIKQTAIIAAPVLIAMSLKKFGLKTTFRDAGLAAVFGFVMLTPLIFSGYHPSIAYTPVLAKLTDFVGPAGEHGMPISWDTYNIWTLFTVFQGQHGLSRLAFPDFQNLPFVPISYSVAADILFGLVLASLILLVFLSRNKSKKNLLFVFMAIILLSFVVLGTRTLGRYYVLAIPFLIGSYFSVNRFTFWTLLAITTSVSLVTMYGALSSSTVDYGLLSFILDPNRNPVASAILQAYTNDLFITIVALIAIVALVYLLISVARISLGLGPKCDAILINKSATLIKGANS